MEKELGSVALTSGALIVPGGMNWNSAAATFCPFLKPVTVTLHFDGRSATGSTTSRAQPNQKLLRSKAFTVEPGYCVEMVGVPLVTCCSMAVMMRLGSEWGITMPTVSCLPRIQELKRSLSSN